MALLRHPSVVFISFDTAAWAPSACMSFDMAALGSLRLCVDMAVVGTLCLVRGDRVLVIRGGRARDPLTPFCPMRQRWASFAFVSSDTAAFALGSFDAMPWGFPLLSCRSTRGFGSTLPLLKFGTSSWGCLLIGAVRRWTSCLIILLRCYARAGVRRFCQWDCSRLFVWDR